LVVDGIVSQQEVVAKPLGAHLRDVRGVAGATSLGNGQVIIILDLLELLARPIPETLTLPVPGQRSQASAPSLYPPSSASAVSGALSSPARRPPAPSPAAAPAAPPFMSPFEAPQPSAPIAPPFGAPATPMAPPPPFPYAAPSAQPPAANQWAYPAGQGAQD